MSYEVVNYWPFDLQANQWRRFDYTDPTNSMPPITAVFGWDKGSNSLLYIDYDAHLNWKDTWYMQYRAGTGVVEWRDDYPGKKVVVDGAPFGRAIFWGDTIDIGQTSVTYPKMNPFLSWPPAASGGCQCLAFEAHLSSMVLFNGTTYDDVLQFTYLQSWDGKPGTGARYFMARGVGPIAVQWIAQDPSNPIGKPLIQTARMDSVVTNVNGSSLVA
jgi:hypothetical protein